MGKMVTSERFWILSVCIAALSLVGSLDSPAADTREFNPSVSAMPAQALAPDTKPGDPEVVDRPDADAYRIDTGDRVSITVYQEPDLSVQGVRVKANGTIAFPLLGDLKVAGLTSQKLHTLVTEKLLDGYLKKPNITVSIDSYRLYYIKGEVNRPGGYSFVDGLTVAKAVALAGGYTERASERSISLVRESKPGTPFEAIDSNMPIRPGDIITVGESFF